MGRRTIARVAAALGLSLITVHCSLLPRPNDAARQLRAQESQLNSLRRASAVPVNVKFSGSHVSFASFDVPARRGNPEESAREFLERFANLYQLPSPRESLVVSRVAQRERGATVFVDQHVDGIVVFGAQLAVQVENGRVLSTNGAYITEVPVVRIPALTPGEAVEAATKHASATFKDAKAAGTPPSLVYFNHAVFRSPAEIEAIKADALTRLAWKLTILGESGADGFVYFIDAQTGAILERLRLVHDARDRSVATAAMAIEFFCGFIGGTQWFREGGVVQGATPDAEGFGAFAAAGATYDFYRNRFGRDSYDNRGSGISMHLDVPALAGNAGARRSCNDLGFGNNMGVSDVVTHEFTHLVINHTANFMTGITQSGSLHESYADVFAALVDTANWTLGETAAGGVIRDMSNPPAVMGPEGLPFPDRMGLFNSSPASAHTNANIMDKAAFLIGAGGTATFTGITVTGIGRDKLGALYHDVLTGFLTNNASFATVAIVTTVRARTFAASGTFGFTPADACNVNQAFAAVELSASDLDCDLVPDTSDPDRDGDTVGNSVDNCPTVFNPSQANTDGDGLQGDACDTDDDNDGVLDTADNCPQHANPPVNNSQPDLDRDGLGDACDDFDRDGRFDATDNCVLVANGNQANSDGDAFGDACDVDRDGDGVCQIRRAVSLDDVGVPPGGCAAADNCPLVSNPGQQDQDGDLMGDACDSCANADSGRDEDRDGIDSACDTDDDGDQIADGNDNCPTVANADQRDLNGNGVGQACDPLEQVRVGPGLVNEFRPRPTLERHQVIEIPLVFDRDPRACAALLDRDIQIDIASSAPIAAVMTDYDGMSVRFAPGRDGTGLPAGGLQSASFRPAFDACALGRSARLRDAGFNTVRAYRLAISPLEALPADARLVVTTRLVERKPGRPGPDR